MAKKKIKKTSDLSGMRIQLEQLARQANERVSQLSADNYAVREAKRTRPKSREGSDLFKGDKNPNAKCNTTEEYRKSISPFSKSFKNYVGLTDEEKEKKIRECFQSDRDDRNTNQVKYWIKKGYSEEESKQKVSERQRTFTLEKCIEKYGEEEGIKRYTERQTKWSAKVEAMYQQGMFSKVPLTQNSSIFSKFEKDMVDSIIDELNLDLDIDDINCYRIYTTIIIYFPPNSFVMNFCHFIHILS